VVESFVLQRKAAWDRLERLISVSRAKRMSALSAEEIMEMGHLYRLAAADLSIARRDFPADRVVAYLNQLVARAHGVVYQSQAGEWRGVTAFFTHGFPALFRETLPFTGAAFIVFLVASIAGFFAVLLAPDSVAYLVPESIASSVREQRMWTEQGLPPGQLMASLIMTNNIRVALFAFAGGVLFGSVTFYAMAFNGLSIGAVAGICQAYGLSLRLWSFIAPHGFIELTVVFIAGGSGLQLGWALLHPGLYSRREALLIAARRAMKLIFGCVPLLIVAGTIEGFVSPSTLPPEAKLAFGVLTAIALYSYLFLAGRTSASQSGARL